jgi:hypothetical protein
MDERHGGTKARRGMKVEVPGRLVQQVPWSMRVSGYFEVFHGFSGAGKQSRCIQIHCGAGDVGAETMESRRGVAEKRAKVWLWLRVVPLPGEVFQVFRVLRAGTAEVKSNEVGTSEVTFLLSGCACRDLSDCQGGRAAS